MSRFVISGSLLSFLIALMACGSSEVEVDPSVTEGCKALCDAQALCGTTSPPEVPCADACVADVGFPDAACGQALEAWAACVKADCKAPCTAEQEKHGQTCGGKG